MSPWAVGWTPGNITGGSSPWRGKGYGVSYLGVPEHGNSSSLLLGFEQRFRVGAGGHSHSIGGFPVAWGNPSMLLWLLSLRPSRAVLPWGLGTISLPASPQL